MINDVKLLHIVFSFFSYEKMNTLVQQPENQKIKKEDLLRPTDNVGEKETRKKREKFNEKCLHISFFDYLCKRKFIFS